jgi:hypothetical protein
VTPADDVVERAGKVCARAPWHEGFPAQEDFNKQINKDTVHAAKFSYLRRYADDSASGQTHVFGGNRVVAARIRTSSPER